MRQRLNKAAGGTALPIWSADADEIGDAMKAGPAAY